MTEAKAKTCKNGHEMTPENTRITAQGYKACRTCARIRSAEYNKRNYTSLRSDQ